MAQGDAKIGDLTSIAAAASMTIQPASGETWLLKGIAYGGQCEMYLTDGTNSVLIDSDGAGGQMNNLNILISNTQYITVKNVGASAVYMRYDAVQWS